MAILNWGVDSASAVSQELYECVQQTYGQPDFWGRYLHEIENVSDGLTPEEIQYIHSLGMKLLPIYNNFSEAVGSRAGTVAARNAIFQASRLHLERGSFIFANIENFFPVDADWLIAWVDTFYTSDYRPGFYNDPVEGPFNQAFCEAAARSERVREQAVLWSAEPEPGPTPKHRIPGYQPSGPDCDAHVFAWQYGRDSTNCPIDTVLMQDALFQALA